MPRPFVDAPPHLAHRTPPQSRHHRHICRRRSPTSLTRRVSSTAPRDGLPPHIKPSPSSGHFVQSRHEFCPNAIFERFPPVRSSRAQALHGQRTFYTTQVSCYSLLAGRLFVGHRSYVVRRTLHQEGPLPNVLSKGKKRSPAPHNVPIVQPFIQLKTPMSPSPQGTRQHTTEYGVVIPHSLLHKADPSLQTSPLSWSSKPALPLACHSPAHVYTGGALSEQPLPTGNTHEAPKFTASPEKFWHSALVAFPPHYELPIAGSGIAKAVWPPKTSESRWTIACDATTTRHARYLTAPVHVNSRQVGF